MERLGLEVPAGFADADADFGYDDDEDSHSDGDGESDDDDGGGGESDDDDDDGNARVIKNPRLVHCGDDYEMGAPPAAGAAVAVVVAGLHRPSPMRSANCRPFPAVRSSASLQAACPCRRCWCSS